MPEIPDSIDCTTTIQKNIFYEKSEKILNAVKKMTTAYTAYPSSFLKGSITVETALILPLLLFALYLLLVPVRVMDESRKLQNRMEAAAKNISLFSYAESVGEKYLNPQKTEENLFILNGISESVIKGDILQNTDGNIIENVKIDMSPVLYETNNNDDMVVINAEYNMKMPFSVFGIEKYRMSGISSRRRWIGAAGGRGREKYSDGSVVLDDNDDDRIVYIGKTSTRYHLDRHCHYIDNSMKQTDGSLIPELRNSSGGKYHPCPSCKPSGKGTVYYFSDGTAYHSGPDCKAICSYVKEVRLGEVRYLGACSYCGKGK